MKKIYIYIFILGLLLVGCTKDKIVNNDISEVMDMVKIKIDGYEYIINLENNDTVDSLINMLPLKLNMEDLNSNEKYAYLDRTLPTNSYNPKTINKGDVMLYGSNCIVIFYKTFNTVYSYTKIGHIDNLPDFNDDDISIIIEK